MTLCAAVVRSCARTRVSAGRVARGGRLDEGCCGLRPGPAQQAPGTAHLSSNSSSLALLHPSLLVLGLPSTALPSAPDPPSARRDRASEFCRNALESDDQGERAARPVLPTENSSINVLPLPSLLNQGFIPSTHAGRFHPHSEQATTPLTQERNFIRSGERQRLAQSGCDCSQGLYQDAAVQGGDCPSSGSCVVAVLGPLGQLAAGRGEAGERRQARVREGRLQVREQGDGHRELYRSYV